MDSFLKILEAQQNSRKFRLYVKTELTQYLQLQENQAFDALLFTTATIDPGLYGLSAKVCGIVSTS